MKANPYDTPLVTATDLKNKDLNFLPSQLGGMKKGIRLYEKLQAQAEQ